MNIAVAVAIWLVLLAPRAQAADVRLKDGTTVKADVFQVDDEHVIVGVPRDSVTTINGKALPAVLKEGTVAPPFSVKDITGQSQTVGSEQGKITLLHFWVSWCPHCRSDAPRVQALYDQYRDDGNVRVVTVDLDRERAPLDRFIKEHQVTFPVIHAADQAATPHGVDVPELYQVTGFPITYVIDQQGVIRRKISGSFVETGVDLAALIQELLAQPTPRPKKGS